MKKALFELALGMAMMADTMAAATQSGLSHIVKSNIGRNAYKKRKKRLAMAKQSRRTNR